MKRITKQQQVNEIIGSIEVLHKAESELDLLLENNYGVECQDLYALVERDPEEIEFKKMTLEDARKFKKFYINAVYDFLHWYLNWNLDFEASQGLIERGIRETGFNPKLDAQFLRGLNGSEENIEVFRRVLSLRKK